MDLQATVQLLGNVGEFVGSIAIVVTLVYLAIQIRQSSRSATLIASQGIRVERMTWFIANRDSAHVPAIIEKCENGETLSLEEHYRLTNHNAALWSTIYSQWMHQELGLTGRFSTKDTGIMHQALIMPGAIQWWEERGEAIYPEEFCRYVESRMSELRGTAPRHWFEHNKI